VQGKACVVCRERSEKRRFFLDDSSFNSSDAESIQKPYSTFFGMTNKTVHRDFEFGLSLT